MKLDLSKDHHQNKARHFLKSWIEQGAKVDMKRIQGKRSLSQNSYFHVLVDILANNLGYTPEEMKIVIKRKSGLVYEKNGEEFEKSTADLEKDEMSDLISWMRVEWPYLPDSTYVTENWASLQVEIESGKYY